MDSINTNPLDLDMILKLVLEHVGRNDVAELKNCRLVNHSWNKIAVQVLEQQHGYALELNYNKMLVFKSLLWNTQLSRMNSEFKKLISLRLSLTLYPVSYFENFSQVGHLLRIHPHVRVALIELINCTYSPTKQSELKVVNHELCNFLKLASTNLTNITILNIMYVGEETRTPFGEFVFGSSVFPRLTTVRYNRSCSEVDTEESAIAMVADWTNHMVSITQNAPNLTKLIIGVNEGNSERSANSIGLILQGCAARLKELGLEEGVDEELLKVLAKIKFPSLGTLKLRRRIPNFTNEFSQFVANNCPNLTSIYMEWNSTPENEDLRMEQMELYKNTWPNIINFGLYPPTPSKFKPEYLDNWKYIRAIFARGLTMFPTLQSLGTTLDVLLMLGANLKIPGQLVPSPQQYPIFSNISSLDLKINSTSRELLGDLDMTPRIYQHTFPNLKKLIIKPIHRLFAGRLYLTAPIAIIELLCCHPGIQYLEIHSCGFRFLDQLDQLTSNNENHILAGLKSLKLVDPKVDSSAKTIKLVSRLPSLEYLQVGKEIVSRAEIQAIRNVSSRLEKP